MTSNRREKLAATHYPEFFFFFFFFNIFAIRILKFFVKFPPGMTRADTCSYLLMSCVLMDPGSSRMQLRLFL
jgi:hypothetical protein